MEKILNFKGSWRSYQKRILDSLDFHLMDEKLHIIAAPGAGKTTLGIEVISRINRAVIVLVPTNTIKNQWVKRIKSSFMDEKDYGLISTDIRNPGFITVITYQALLAAFCGRTTSEITDDYAPEEDVDEDSITSSRRFNMTKADEVIQILKQAKISMLCFDEAHHLRKEWWKALTYLVEELNPEQTVALTATPPYDADYNEWQRYEELCGPIDEMISIPELVKNGDLCPHQDFIYFSNLRDGEKELISKYSKKVKEFIGKVFNDKQLLIYLRGMDFLINTDDNVEQILDNPDLYVSIVSLLHSTGSKIPVKFLKLFNAKEFEVPRFGLKHAKVFLNGFLITNTDLFKGVESKIEEYLNLAKKSGLIQNRRIVLDDSAKIQKQIANSLGKLDSIVDIVKLETSTLGKDLRMVILADYIKANDVDNSHLGVVPIWRTLKAKFSSSLSIGVLCGSLILLPKSKLESFYDLLQDNNLTELDVTINDYKEDSEFAKITPKNSLKHSIVSLVTEMFNRGDVTVLVGTQALLGEGWDAPSINSLILSSTVSSYMLSNQMRGRAIRVDKNNPNKISNIWHLASIKVPKPSDFTENLLFLKTFSDVEKEDAGLDSAALYDLNQLKKRFEGYEAPSYFDKHEIVSGISRIVPRNVTTAMNTGGEKVFTDLNIVALRYATDRVQTKRWWDEGLNLGYNRPNMMLSTGVDTPRLTAKSLTYTSYKYLFVTLTMIFLGILAYFGKIILYSWPLLYLFLGFYIICALFLFIKFLTTGSVTGVMKQIAIVHLETMAYLDLIKTSTKNAGIEVQNTDSIYITCKNLPTDENNLLIKCIQEFLDPIENPRYIMVKRNKIFGANQVDYFAIPAILSQNKSSVEIFQKLWEKYIGSCEIIYTRNFEGRKLLLKARRNAFSSMKREKSSKISKWQ